MEKEFFLMLRLDPELVFENLQWTRVIVKLKGESRRLAIDAIKAVLQKAPDREKRSVQWQILHAVQRELFKSKEIDVATMEKVATYYPLCVQHDTDPPCPYADYKFPWDESADEVHEYEDEDDGEFVPFYLGEGEDARPMDLNQALNPSCQSWESEDRAFYDFLCSREQAVPNDFKEAALDELKKQIERYYGMQSERWPRGRNRQCDDYILYRKWF